MKNHKITYKEFSILLLFSMLTLSGCSNVKEDLSDKPSEPLGVSVPQKVEDVPSEETSPVEILPEEAEADTAEPVIIEEDWADYFDGINGAAVIYTPSENRYRIYNQETALSKRSPCSTFKIISSLIALEHNVIVPEDSTRTWSGEIFWNENWNRDISFEDAFQTSCVWYYREVIDEIGKDVMQEELDRLNYGNCDISDWEGYLNTNNNNRALTGFWIESSLKISPKEQVEVLERIFGEDSVYSQETQNNLKQVMLVSERQDADTLIYGKTGMGKMQGVVVDAWFTGFTDTADGRSYFCIYLGETEGKDVSGTKAKEIAIEIVSDNDNEKWARIPMVMVDGELYLTTGFKSTTEGRCGVMDGEIESSVDCSEIPTENNQSNFGFEGTGYQYGATEGTIELYIDDKWWIYATEEVRQELQFPDETEE